MTETIIRWAINVVLLVLAFIWGYREGQVKTLILYAKAMKDVEDGLLSIITICMTDLTNTETTRGEQNDKTLSPFSNQEARH